MTEENVEKVKNDLPRNLKPIHDGNIRNESEPINDVNVTELLHKLGQIGKMLQ